MLKRVDRYILKEIFPPFFLGLVLYAFVLMMNQILILSELFIAKGVSLGTALEVLGLLLPSILAFAVPMAVLMGILAGLSRLSTDLEITAFKTLGIGYGRIARPLLIFAFAGWLLTSGLVHYVAPRANHRWVQTVSQSVLAKVRIEIAPRTFDESIPGMVLFVQDIARRGEWENIFVHMSRPPDEPRTILARRGRLNIYPEEKRGALELFDGTVHSVSLSEPGTYGVTSFERLDEEVEIEGVFASLDTEKRVREKDIGELLHDVRALKAETAALKRAAVEAPSPSADQALALAARSARAHQVEIHKKFALPFVCFLFVLIGLPLGATTRKGGRTSGFTLSIGIILAYYVLITAGEKLAMDGRISPFSGMWGANAVLFAAGLILYIRSVREKPFAWPAGLFRRLVPSREAGKTPKTGRVRLRARLRASGILDRYVAKKYMAVFTVVFLGLVSVAVIVTFFERIDNVYARGKPLSMFLEYIWFRIPEFSSFVLPVAALTTALLVLGMMTKNNEVTAVKACGISLYRFVVPVIVLAVAVSGLSFALQERILPAANLRAEDIWNRINDVPPRSYSFVNRHWILSRSKDRIFHYDFFDPIPSVFSRVSVFDIDGPSWTLNRRAFGEKGYLDEKRIILVSSWLRDFREEGPGAFRTAREESVAIEENRDYFLKEWKEPSQMTYGELDLYAREAQSMGFEATRLRVDLGYKLSFPFVALVMTFLAVPFAFAMGRSGTLVGIGLSIGIAMVYWGAIGVFRGLGYVGYLGPFLSAWGPNLLFGLAGIYLFLRLRT
jgi:LPS export ABC transporter permease LptF/LPS export ABC transporter permease LptG